MLPLAGLSSDAEKSVDGDKHECGEVSLISD
jgi:hypothetical protein